MSGRSGKIFSLLSNMISDLCDGYKNESRIVIRPRLPDCVWQRITPRQRRPIRILVTVKSYECRISWYHRIGRIACIFYYLQLLRTVGMQLGIQIFHRIIDIQEQLIHFYDALLSAGQLSDLRWSEVMLCINSRLEKTSRGVVSAMMWESSQYYHSLGASASRIMSCATQKSFDPSSRRRLIIGRRCGVVMYPDRWLVHPHKDIWTHV